MKNNFRALLPGFFVLFTAFAGGCMIKNLTPEATPIARPVASPEAPEPHALGESPVMPLPPPHFKAAMVPEAPAEPVPAGPFPPGAKTVAPAEPRKPAAPMLSHATAALAIANLPAAKPELKAPIELAPTEPEEAPDEVDEAAAAASPKKTAIEEPKPEAVVVEAPDKLQATAIAIVGLSSDGAAVATPVRAYLHDKVRLHAVVRGREDGREIAVADPAVVAAGAVPWKQLPVRHFSAAEAARLAWFKVEPEAHEYWNSEPSTGRFSFKKVPYHESAWKKGVAAVTADARPLLHDENPHGFGTMRFKVAYAKGDDQVATAGAASMNPMRPDNLFRVSYAGVTRYPLINHALELCNVPYVFGSETPTKRSSDHQSEWAYGVDCADLVSYSLRHAGVSFPYGFTGTFDPGQGRTRFVARPTIKDGVYVNAQGEPIKWGPGGVQPQDFILYDGKIRHIGILYRDAAPRGVFDPNDIIVHTLVAAPTFAGVQEAFGNPFQVVRLKSGAPELASAPTPKVPAAAAKSSPKPSTKGETAAKPVRSTDQRGS
jgi:hypothetical protein